ncbi:peptidoglycan-binding protein [Sinorhizobium fredii]|uniref:peptidoglycan-binding protein n=1 Tax=Rhizobium fredii TaxID=380 RepID=UPI0035176080
MRRVLFASVTAFQAAIWTAPPALAQFGPEDLLRLGTEILGNSSRERPPTAQNRRSAAPQRGPQAPSSGRNSYDPGNVAEVQRILNELGYSAGPVDGEMGSQTRRAIIDFQRNTGLRQTGRPDSALLGALLSVQAQGGLAKVPVRPSDRPDAFNTTAGTAGWPQTGAPAEFTILPGYDLPNGDYRSGVTDPRLKVVSTAECQQLCAQDSQCQAFTYNERARVCILKDRVLQQARFAGAVSGIKAGAVALGGNSIQTEMQAGGPSHNGRLLVRGASAYSTVLSDNVVAQFGQMAVHIALDRFPDILQDDHFAFAALRYLDNQSQRRIVGTAGIAAEKVLGYPGSDYTHRLDEFERRALLKSIRMELPPVVAVAAPDFPIPVLIFCTVALGEYDFDRQRFPIGETDRCNSINLGGASLGNMNITAPIPTAYLPDNVPVPLEKARDYKRSIMGSDRSTFPVLGIEARLTGMGERHSNNNIRQFEFEVEVERALLFRPDNLAQPFEKLPMIPIPSVDTVEVAPTGPVPLNDDTVSLLLLARKAMDFSEAEFVDWARRRAYQESSGHPGPWAPFFREQVADDLSSGAQPEPQLLANFAEWNRARARALPEALTVRTQNATLEWLQREALPGGVRVFSESSDKAAFASVTPRLNVPPAQLFGAGNTGWFAGSAGLAGLGPIEFALILPAPREEFTVKVNTNVKPGADNLDVTVELRVRDVRLDRLENQPPLVALYVEPVKAHVTAPALGGVEIGSAVFDLRHPDTAIPDVGASAPGSNPSSAAASRLQTAIPFQAEAMDLLQLHYAPETVDGRWIELMMVARHEYEDTMAHLGETPIGGWFFRDPSKPLEEDDRAKRLPEFREWSKTRANSLPETLTLTLELQNGAARFEHRGESPRGTVCQSTASQGSASEKSVMQAKLCAFLNAAWASPEPLLYYEEHVTDSAGIGPRYGCGGERYCPEYANYHYNVRQDLGLPPAYDLVRLDRLPALDEATRKLDGKLALEIDVAPTGVTRMTTWPDSFWREANRRARPFDEAHGLRIAMEPSETKLAGPVFIFEAKALAARVVNTETGETVAEPPLAAPPPLSDTLLKTSASNVRHLNVLGIQLGMTFEEAERLIREHMEVGRVFKAERAGQIGLASGKIEPYSSGRLFVSRAENEAIAIFDEPPAAPGVVLGMWRRLRLPKGSIDPTGLKATLTERYGPPNATEEVYPTGTNDKGVAFLWRDAKHERQDCGQLSQHEQSGRWWRDEAGASAQPPPFLKHYPVLGSAYHFEPTPDGEDKPLSEFCPPILGVWYATYPVPPGSEGMGDQFMTGVDPRVPQIKQWAEQVAKVAEQMQASRAVSESTADEIMTWLNDQRSYAKLFFESRRAASAQSAAPAKAMPKIKF